MASNNNKDKCNVPHLRFPEFSGEWKMATFGDIAKGFDYGMNAAAKSFDGNNKYIRITDIDEVSSQYLYDDVVSPDGELEDRYLVKENDILLARTGASTGKSYLYRNSDGKLYFAGFLIRANIYKHNSYFVFSQLHTLRYKKWISVMSARSGQPGINSQEYASFPVYTTSLQEEDKIATFLKLLDERIITQNKIIEDLKKLKSAIIEKTFNENYSNKIRLRDVGSYIRGLTYSSDDVVESNGIFVMRSNNIINGSSLDYHNNIVSVNKQILTEQQLQTGDIVICMANGSSSLVGKSSFYDGDCSTPITVGAFCGIYRSKEPIVKWLFQTNKYRRYIWNSLQGGNGAIANLNGDDILRMSFSIPATPAKDNRIKLLTSVDTLLESNISLCDLYISQKLYLLRQMFI
ncbi:restriction endonuclease subunit S [Bacteroides xylanisolvens]|uniref:restriction endonuclease subunit S n=2 Tax=Bacteroides xylanisolvens TaxID=371601 RepID=UPI001269CEE9|nr:restriction endonuclease subunit S [Bacteroides xylanisolvens]KAB6400982.1 restriction endonuclease subunit S [Bacteroides xylanisolvens]